MKRNDVVIICQAASLGRDTKVAVLRQIEILDARANLVAGQVIVETTMVVDGECSLVVFDPDAHWKGLVAKVAQASTDLLVYTVSINNEWNFIESFLVNFFMREKILFEL